MNAQVKLLNHRGLMKRLFGQYVDVRGRSEEIKQHGQVMLGFNMRIPTKEKGKEQEAIVYVEMAYNRVGQVLLKALLLIYVAILISPVVLYLSLQIGTLIAGNPFDIVGWSNSVFPGY